MAFCWFMVLLDVSSLSFIDKIKSFVFCFKSDPTAVPGEFIMGSGALTLACNCELNLRDSFLKYHCQNCTRLLCGNCRKDCGSLDSKIVKGDSYESQTMVFVRSCSFCSGISTLQNAGRRYNDKIYPDESPSYGSEPQSPACSVEGYDGYSPHGVSKSSAAPYPSPVSFRRSPSRSDEDEGEDSASNPFSPSSEYCHDISDIETSSVRSRPEFYNLRSVGSSPYDSPSGVRATPIGAVPLLRQEQQGANRSREDGSFNKEAMPDLRGAENSAVADGTANDVSMFHEHYVKSQKPLDFESNGLIWSPPPPEDENEDTDNNYFTYNDEDDEIGDLSSSFSSSGNADAKEPLRSVVQGHFRALVSQLLQGEGVKLGRENDSEDWLDIVSAVAWQAANFVKPDTSKGGSMDPVKYIKIKCVASGVPADSKLIKGVACSKNIKHKRMTSQHKNPKLLLLGGALEFQRVANQLESFDVLRQQEIDHLKMIVSKIEALRTNVLLVEKSVSSYAQEYLLAKDISLVLNVKRTLLERIARCTGARIAPSVDKISTTQLGHCECFRLEKFQEEHEVVNQLNKKPSKTLMFFEGCPRHLGCTVLLKGSCREELKKVKHVLQYAVFAAYHLSLETSFLADEGASLPKLRTNPSFAISDSTPAVNSMCNVVDPNASLQSNDVVPHGDNFVGSELHLRTSGDHNPDYCDTCTWRGCEDSSDFSGVANLHITSDIELNQVDSRHSDESLLDDSMKTHQHERQQVNVSEADKLERVGETETSFECYRSGDTSQSILVSFSSRCILNETVCERSRLLRIKFYGSSDKPLGRYLRDDLFDQTSSCQSCKEPTEAHVICYTHKQGNLTINVRRVPSVRLPGERDGKIWMWHRCLRCAYVDGIPPANRRVVMSDAAWGLSFGKFLELSFLNHTTANRIATCGHSLQRDCLRYYGYGSMVAFFRYSPIEILSVSLPLSRLEFNVSGQEWMSKEATEFMSKAEALYAEMSAVLRSIDRKITSFGHEYSDASELHNHVTELHEMLTQEKGYYHDMLEIAAKDSSKSDEAALDILELNRLRHSLLISSHVWDHRLNSLDSLLTKNTGVKASHDNAVSEEEISSRNEKSFRESCFEYNFERNWSNGSEFQDSLLIDAQGEQEMQEDPRKERTVTGGSIFQADLLEPASSAASTLSDTIDSVWTGSGQLTGKVQLYTLAQTDRTGLMAPARVYSFDSATRLQERIKKGLPPSSLHLSMLKSFHASGDYRSMIRDPVVNVQRTVSQMSPNEAERLDAWRSASPSFISSASLLSDGARLMVAQNSQNDIVIAVYDNEPSSIISYALSSKEYEDWVTDKSSGPDGISNVATINIENLVASELRSWQSFGSLDMDYVHYGSYASEDSTARVGSFFADPKTSPHVKISFLDESSNCLGKVKFSVTCYLAKEFDALRKKCCPSEADFIRSLSRCKTWSAQGGKSKVFFARSLDERFIIKQVTKTELESFEEFAPKYFKYLTESLNSGSPTCLAKVLGIYQVSIKYLKGGKETKMDLMVMENLFFKRKISRVYDLKGSARSRYVPGPTEADKVLLDLNLLETLRTKPIFLGSKAKRNLERAVWNDTSFLASIDVMDYSLLVGVDDENKELVLGIIDFMRQYTWDKHLETWVKASGILGGPKNASPTIISPKQYKKRFRKAMSTYFLTVPDQWPS